MNVGYNLPMPSCASAMFARVIGIVPITEPSLDRAQEMNSSLDKESTLR